MKRRPKNFAPIVLGWSKSEQRRFIDAVEKFHALVSDLERVLSPAKRKRQMKDATAAAMQGQANGQPEKPLAD